MGDSSAVEVEFENIRTAVKTVSDIADRIGDLKRDFSNFSDSVKASDWSTEPSCLAFGESYKSALAVYTDVIAGMQADLANYSAALDAAADSYEVSDANATAALTKLGTVDDQRLQQDAQGRTAYEQAGHHEDLTSDAPEQAPDTTPNGGAGTTFPGSTGNGGNGGGADPTNNAVDPGTGAGSSAGPSGSSRHGQS